MPKFQKTPPLERVPNPSKFCACEFVPGTEERLWNEQTRHSRWGRNTRSRYTGHPRAPLEGLPFALAGVSKRFAQTERQSGTVWMQDGVKHLGQKRQPRSRCPAMGPALPPADGEAPISTTGHGKDVASAAKGQKGTDTLTDAWNEGEIKVANERRRWVRGGCKRQSQRERRQKVDSRSKELNPFRRTQSHAVGIAQASRACGRTA